MEPPLNTHTPKKKNTKEPDGWESHSFFGGSVLRGNPQVWVWLSLLIDLAIVGEAPHGGDGLFREVVVRARVVGVVLEGLADAVDLPCVTGRSVTKGKGDENPEGPSTSWLLGGKKGV